MTRIALLTVFVGLFSAWVAVAQDRGTFSINPVMARGPATAPVTIVEFSDYQ